MTTLLSDIDLDEDVLIGLNVTGAQAESVLDAVRTWRETNAVTLASHKSTIAQKKLALGNLQKSIRTGPAQEGQAEALATALSELNTAQAAYASALQPLEQDVYAELSASQDATWSSVQQGFGKVPIGLLSLTGPQRLDLSRAWRQYRWRYAAATTAQERSSASSTWNTDITTILTESQQLVLSTYNTYVASSTEAVVDAFETVLPPAGA